ncbi:MAG: WD40 repeat domain-containing protein [Treponema sp.]|nr:WD40 repeat domain-containing protein [Treponema sp.]
MTGKRKKHWLIVGIPVFLLYVFAAAQPIPVETVLRARWLTSLESNYPIVMEETPRTGGETSPLPFRVGNRFGYLDEDGRFSINKVRSGYISMSETSWAEYGAAPEQIEIFDPLNKPLLTLTDPQGYPLFLDDRIFLVGKEQNSITALDGNGNESWRYDFSAPLSCIDAAAGLVLTGSLDGVVELLDSSGRLVFAPFEPGGSRLAVILGCALSRDGSRFAVVSGIDDQRFLLLEKSADAYRVIYHEFLTDGFRRPVYLSYTYTGRRGVFDREGGLGLYDIDNRTSVFLPMEGEIAALDGAGSDNLLFIISSLGEDAKKLAAVSFPGRIILEAPFKSASAFLSRRGNRIYVGGDSSMVSFELFMK